MKTQKHTHYCPSCGLHVDCEAARTGGCPFRNDPPATCGPCVARQFGGDPERAKHLCECTAPSPPVDGAVCNGCGRWVDLAYGVDRVFDLAKLGDAPPSPGPRGRGTL